MARFNPPPNWPDVPEGWSPPKGWKPGPELPSPPKDWPLWVDEKGKKTTGPHGVYGGTTNAEMAGGCLILLVLLLCCLGGIGAVFADDDGDEGESHATASSTSSSSSTTSSSPSSKSPKSEKSSSSKSPKSEKSSSSKPASSTTTKADDRKEGGPDSGGKLYNVVRVIDGDTVEVAINGGESIRVIGIDTPETVHPNVPDECWGAEASRAATDLLSGQQVRVVFDPSQGKRDRYDRMLAYLDIPGTGDFGEIMLRQGHAEEYTYNSAYARQSTYRRVDQQARNADKGLWGACGGTDVPIETPTPTPAPAPAPPPTQAPAPTQAPPTASNCAPGYSPCIPNSPTDLNCPDVNGPITVTGSDPYGLDRDGDGIACEW